VALRIAVPVELTESVANFLLERGATAVVIEDGEAAAATIESALPAGDVGACRAALGRWLASLVELEPRARDIRVATEPAADVDWAVVWRRHHRPIAIGDRLLIAPPWDVPAAADRKVLVIEPATAFGTGQHATTRACLEAIEKAVARGGIRSVLDVGTGSGILAIAAARFGVGRVVALDVDPRVLPAARANLLRNGAERVLLVAGRAAALRASFDLVVANLFADEIVADAPALARVVAPRGRLVLSGLTATQVSRVTAAWPGWNVVETRVDEEWRTLALERASC